MFTLAHKIKYKLTQFLAALPFGRRRCIICGKKSLYFLPCGQNEDIFQKINIIGGGWRKNCKCPHCKSLDRYRWTWYVIVNFTDILSTECKVLHIAPEPQIAQKIKKINPNCTYITGDLAKGRADYIMDITNLPAESNTFDYVIINHVLEHISDENAALSEIKRVLKPDGKFLFSIPIAKDRKTFEDKTITSSASRIKAFGQDDHCRLYGNDVLKHFESFGFKIQIYTPQELLEPSNIKKLGFLPDDRLFSAELNKSSEFADNNFQNILL